MGMYLATPSTLRMKKGLQRFSGLWGPCAGTEARKQEGWREGWLGSIPSASTSSGAKIRKSDHKGHSL